MRLALSLLVVVAQAGVVAAESSPLPRSQARYRVLSAETGAAPPFGIVDVLYGSLRAEGVEWQLSVRAGDDPGSRPLVQLRAVTSRDPLGVLPSRLGFLEYQVAIPPDEEVLEYRNLHTGGPLLPAWSDFALHFVPRAAAGARRQAGFPTTCEYLGHALTLEQVNAEAAWPSWQKVKTLPLDPELLIGTSRSFKDSEGHRLPQKPQRRDYKYVPLTAEDYRLQIEAGVNLFCISPDQQRYVRGEPVFYIRGADGDPPLAWPADLYRSNYLGNEMFMDEPTCLMIGDKRIHTRLKYFTDAAALITKRVRAKFLGPGGDAYGLEAALRSRGVIFGDMRLLNLDFPSWETVYETAYYQLAGGLAGMVHEGRYQLDEFNANARASTGLDRVYTVEEMLRYHIAFLRGAARRFGKDWGISIYGQADPRLSPQAMRLAYDRGARYLWYWTSDHDHHLPWPEQIELTRAIRRHIAEHPRPSIRRGLPTLDKVILIPYGYFLTLESPTQRKQPFDLWWVRELDAEGKNESSQRYRRLVRNTFAEINRALDAGEDFDISVDDGRQATGYRQVVRVGD